MAVILYPILNWGLGHASRSSVVIRHLLRLGHRILPASDGAAYLYLREVFPQLNILKLPDLEVRYPGRNPIWNMALQSRHILFSFYKDYRALKLIAQQYDIDVVLSDHRLGAFVKGKKNILLLHQIKIPLRSAVLSSLFHPFSRLLLRPFDEYWVPDFEEHLLSGKMTQARLSPMRFIGPISHFTPYMEGKHSSEYYDVIAVLSGPEPQRTLFENQIIGELKNLKLKSLIVRGLPETAKNEVPQSVTSEIYQISFLPPEKLLPLLLHSKYIIARSGYSTIMDLTCIQKSALLVPTPGQPEQEYLMNHLKYQNAFIFQLQEELDIFNGLKRLDKARPIPIANYPDDLLLKVIKYSIS